MNDKTSPSQDSAQSAYEQREQMVKDGDFQRLFEGLINAVPAMLDIGEVFEQTRRAIGVALKADPQRAIDEIYESSLGFAQYALMRMQYLSHREVQALDSSSAMRSPRPPQEVFQEFLPLTIQLSSHVSELAYAWASCRRLLELTARQSRSGGQEKKTGVPAARTKRRCFRSRGKKRRPLL
jgi:hypothetical protein